MNTTTITPILQGKPIVATKWNSKNIEGMEKIR